jgi:hypothetical protein
MNKTHSGFLGLLSDEDNVPTAFPVASADKGGLDNNNVSGTRLVLNTLFNSDNLDNNGEPPPDVPPLAIPRPLV